jgi:hypothetical protein
MCTVLRIRYDIMKGFSIYFLYICLQYKNLPVSVSRLSFQPTFHNGRWILHQEPPWFGDTVRIVNRLLEQCRGHSLLQSNVFLMPKILSRKRGSLIHRWGKDFLVVPLLIFVPNIVARKKADLSVLTTRCSYEPSALDCSSFYSLFKLALKHSTDA